MSTLYLDRRDLALKLEGRALAIYASGERQGTVPTHLLERIVMHSTVHPIAMARSTASLRGFTVASVGVPRLKSCGD